MTIITIKKTASDQDLQQRYAMQLDSIVVQQTKLKLLIEEAESSDFQKWEDIDLELDSIFYE